MIDFVNESLMRDCVSGTKALVNLHDSISAHPQGFSIVMLPQSALDIRRFSTWAMLLQRASHHDLPTSELWSITRSCYAVIKSARAREKSDFYRKHAMRKIFKNKRRGVHRRKI